MSRLQTMLSAGQAIGSLQQAGAFQHPLLKMALKYWWLSIPAGIALYGRIQERRAKCENKMHHYFGAAAEVLGPVMTLVAMAELSMKMQREGKLDTPRPIAQPPSPAIEGMSRLHGDNISPPFVEDTPHPSRQRG
jgi:hypothetical protein